MYLYLFLIILIKISNGLSKSEKPFIESVFTSPNLKEGRKYSITCQVNNGPVSISWLLNGKPIIFDENVSTLNNDESSMLNIKRMSLENSGEYACKIKDFANHEDSKSVTVRLNGKNMQI